MRNSAGSAGLTAGESAVDALLAASHLAAPHELPELIASHAATLGARDAVAYLADVQQMVLVPFLPPGSAADGHYAEPLAVDGTLAGRAFQLVEVLTQAGQQSGVRVWLPMLDGAERVGVLGVTLDDARGPDITDSIAGIRLQRFATLIAELMMTKTMYGDTIVRLRRRAQMDLAAEIQWSLLPPLTFACDEVTLAGALEPAYQVAGDTLDYAVDAGRAQAAVFDGMGHGLRSGQLAAVAVAAYRNARRRDRGLAEIAALIHEALRELSDGRAFATGVFVDLDSNTGMLSWLNPGHPEPLLLRGGRMVKRLHCQPVLPLGIDVGDAVRGTATVCKEQLEPGDRVLLYTDGVIETRSPDGEFFGEQRLVDLLTRNLASGLPSPETMRRVIRALLQHQQGQLTDDATVLLIEWRSEKDALTPT